MNIHIQYYEHAALLKIKGQFGLPDSLELEKRIGSLIEDSNFNIVIDLSGEVVLDFQGSRVIIEALKECRKEGGDIRIVKPSQHARDYLRLTGLDAIFLIYQDESSALNSFLP